MQRSNNAVVVSTYDHTFEDRPPRYQVATGVALVSVALWSGIALLVSSLF